MIPNYLKETGRLTARDDNGKPYFIIEYVEVFEVGEFGNSNKKVEGGTIYLLTSGTPLNRMSETEFIISTSGITVRVPTTKKIQ